MDEYLCKFCGKKLDSSVRVCPDCGALNPYNREVISETKKRIEQEYKAQKNFANGFSGIALFVGIGLLIFHMIMLLSDPAPYLTWQLFVGAVSGAMASIFAIIGMVKKESVGKAVLISLGISLWMLLMFVIFSF